jgi:methyl-accepting chemotaxis protein
VAQVRRVTDLIDAIGAITAITAITLEQSNGIGQVNRAVTQLDRITQKSAAPVRQSPAEQGRL